MKLIRQLVIIWLLLLPWQTVFIVHQAMIGGAVWQYGSYLIYASEVVAWLIVVATAVVLQKQWRQSIADRSILSRMNQMPKVRLLLVGFLLWAGCSIIWAVDPLLALYYWQRLAVAVAVALVVVQILPVIKIIQWLSVGFIGQFALALFQLFDQTVRPIKLLGIAEQLVERAGTAVVETAGGRWLRPYAGFVHPNVFGGFSALAATLKLIVSSGLESSSHRLAWIIMAVFGIFGVWLSLSRSASIAVAIGLMVTGALVVLSFYFGKIKIAHGRKFIMISALMLMALVFFNLTGWQLSSGRIMVSGRIEQASITDRLDQWTQWRAVVSDHGLLGVGLGQYSATLIEREPGLPAGRQVLPAWHYQPVHNVYALIWAELGVVGLGLALAGIAYISLDLWRRRSLFGAPWLTLLVLASFDHYLWTSYFGLALAVLVVALIIRSEDA